jgi:hypothetical protein
LPKSALGPRFRVTLKKFKTVKSSVEEPLRCIGIILLDPAGCSDQILINLWLGLVLAHAQIFFAAA